MEAASEDPHETEEVTETDEMTVMEDQAETIEKVSGQVTKAVLPVAVKQ
jgi:hypothetical protein